MTPLLSNPYDLWIVPSFKRQVSKVHDNLAFYSEVTEVLVKQLLSFSKQWIKKSQVLIKHCFLMGINTVEAKKSLDKRYGDSAPGKSTIIDWYTEFKRGRTNTDDAECSGHPKSTVVPENITKVHKIVLGDRKLKLREIVDTLKISEGSVFTILHESLGMRKFFQSGRHVCSPRAKKNNTSRIQSAVWSCSSEVKRIFCFSM